MTVETKVIDNSIVEIPKLSPLEEKLINDCRSIVVSRYNKSGENFTKQVSEMLYYSMLSVLRFEGEEKLKKYVRFAKLNTSKRSSISQGYC